MPQHHADDLDLLLQDSQLCGQIGLDHSKLRDGTTLLEALAINFLFDWGLTFEQAAQDLSFAQYGFEPMLRSAAALQVAQQQLAALQPATLEAIMAREEADQQCSAMQRLTEAIATSVPVIQGMSAATSTMIDQLRHAPCGPYTLHFHVARACCLSVHRWAHSLRLLSPCMQCVKHDLRGEIMCRATCAEVSYTSRTLTDYAAITRELRRNPQFFFFQRQSANIAQATQDRHVDFSILEDATSLYVHRAATAALKAKMCVRVIDHAEMHESLERTVMYAATRWGALQRAMHSELGSSVCSVSSGESDS